MSSFLLQMHLNPSDCLINYTDPLHRTKMDVIYHKKTGFSAHVYQLDAEGHVVSKTESLPLQGVPKEVLQIKDSMKIKDFFRVCYFIPERGGDGNFNRVAVHLAGLGGGRFKIPFQPGLALGSVIKGETLDKMEKYAHVMTQLEALTEQITAAEQKIEMLGQKIQSKEQATKPEGESDSSKSSSTTTTTTKPSTKAQDALIKFWKKEIAATITLIDKLSAKIEEVSQSSADIPVFEGFQQGIESPLDMNQSHLEVQTRGFDTLNFSSQYIDMKQSLSEIDDQVKHASSANEVSASGGGWGFKVKGSHAWSQATSERLATIKQEDNAKGVLMINATVTTRHVRCFRDLHFDKMKLRTILDAMKNNDKSALKRHGITVRKEKEGDKEVEKEKEIYLLTEAVLGGAFTALVIFLDEAKKNRKMEKKADESGHKTAVGVGGSYLLAKGSVGFSRSSHSGSQSEEDFVNNVSNTNISIEISAEGAIPMFTRDVIQHEIMKHLDLNPAKFELSPQEEAEAEKVVKGSEQEKLVAAHKRQMKMEAAQVAVMNTYRGLTSTKDEQKVHTSKSVIDAYESFATKITSDSDCGIPIGFNYQVLSETRLREILNELEGTPAKPNTKEQSPADSAKKQ